jgi:hypothetical protein
VNKQIIELQIMDSTYDATGDIVVNDIVFTLNGYVPNLNNGYGWTHEYWNKLMKCTLAENKSGVLFPLEGP